MSGTSEGLPVVEGAYEASDAHLKQQISLFGLIALAVSVQVGSGWLLATLAAASLAGVRVPSASGCPARTPAAIRSVTSSSTRVSGSTWSMVT